MKRCLKLIKGIYEKPKVNTLLNGEDGLPSPKDLGQGEDVHCYCSHSRRPSQCNEGKKWGRGEEKKDIYNGKEVNCLYLEMIGSSMQKTTESTPKATSLARSQVTRSMYKSQSYFYVPALNNQK